MEPESAEAAAPKKADEPAGLLDQQQLSVVDKDLDGRIATRRECSVMTGTGESPNQIRCLTTDQTRRSPLSKTVVRLYVSWVRIPPPGRICTVNLI